MDQGTIINILTTYEELFEQYGIFPNMIRGLMMTIVNDILRPICNVLYDVYLKTYELLDFTEYGPVQDLISEFEVFIYVALVISFLILGYIYILDKNNRPDWIKNAFVGLICVLTIPMILGKLNDITYQSSIAVLNWGNTSENATIADSVVLNNAYDLLYMVDNDFYNNGNLNSKNSIRTINAIDIEEVVTADNVIGDAKKDLFRNEVIYNSVGVASLKEIKKDAIFSISDPPYYYRWHIDFLPMIVQLIGIICAYAVCAWKVVQITWELIVDQLLIVLFSGDITGNQRIKKLMNFFINSYTVLLLINVFIKLYQLSFDFISTLEWNSLTKALIICFISFCVAQGPNIVQQILGIDAGISNGFGKLYAAAGIAKGMAGLAKMGAGVAGGVAGGVVGGAGEIIKDRNKDTSGPSSDETRTNESTKMEDVSNKKHDPYSQTESKSDGVIFNENSAPSRNQNDKRESPNPYSENKNTDSRESGTYSKENYPYSEENKKSSGSLNNISDAESDRQNGVYDNTSEPYNQNDDYMEKTEDGLKTDSMSQPYNQRNSSSQSYGDYENEDVQGDRKNNHPSGNQGENPIMEKSMPKMRDLKNERKVIFQEHREGMEKADRSRNSVVRATKAGYQRGKTAVKIVRHGADLINERKNKKKG